MKHCDKCGAQRIPEGGVMMGNGRWCCATCWVKLVNRKGRK